MKAIIALLAILIVISSLLVGCSKEPSSVEEARQCVIGRWERSMILGGRESPVGRQEETYRSDGRFTPGEDGGNTWLIVDLGVKPDSLGNKPIARFAIQYAGGGMMYLVSTTKARNAAGDVMLHKK